MQKTHYDKNLSGSVACGRQNYDHAHEDISKVTCQDCLRANKRLQSDGLKAKQTVRSRKAFRSSHLRLTQAVHNQIIGGRTARKENQMANCVMCDKSVTGYYECEGKKIPICFEHYEDGTFANYLAAQQSVQAADGYCHCLITKTEAVLAGSLCSKCFRPLR